MLLLHENVIECKGTIGSAVELHYSYNYTSNDVFSVNLTYKWWKDGKVLNISSEIVKFSSFQYSDAGNYQCKAFSEDREILCGWITLTTGN